MTPNEPPTPNDDSGRVAEPDALRRLEERLDRASDAAERLIAEAARAAAAARARAGAPAEAQAGGSGERAQPDTGRPDDRAQPDTGRPDDPEAGDRGEDEPSRAQEQPGQPPPAAGKPPPAGWQLPRTDTTDAARDSEIELLANVLQSLRDLIPPELQERLSTALRELLLALRALIDWYIERMERQRAQPPEVEDIPIL